MLEADGERLQLRALEALGDGVAVISLGGHVALWTEVAARLLGYPAEEVVGRPASVLGDLAEDARRLHEPGAPPRIERTAALRGRDGSELIVAATLTVVRNEAGLDVGAVCLLKDVGHWLRLERRPGTAAADLALEAFRGISGRIAASLDLDQTLAAVVRSALVILEADGASVWLLDPAAGVLRLRAEEGHPPGFGAIVLPVDRGLAGEAFRTGEIQRADDHAALPARERPPPGATELGGFRSAMVAPLLSRGRRLGILGVSRRVVRPFEGDALFLCRILAEQAGMAIDNAIAYGELAAARGRLEALLESTDAIWRARPIAEMTAGVTREATAVLGVECSLAVIPPEHPGCLRIVAATGEAAALVGVEWAFAGTATAAALRDRAPIETAALQEEVTFAPELRERMAGMEVRTARIVPLVTGEPLSDGRPALGLLAFTRPGRIPFGDDQREMMDEFGKRISLALHRAELLETERATARRLRTVIEAGADLAGSLDAKDVIRRTLQRAVLGVGADRGVLVRVDRGDLVIEDCHDPRRGSGTIGARAPLESEPALARVIRKRQPEIDSLLEPRAHPEAGGLALEDVLHRAIVPLVVGGEVAALLVLHRRTDVPFLPGDLDTLQLIANQAALALTNARLFAQVEEASRSKSDFMNMAAHELRTPLSVISGYLSLLEEGSVGQPPPAWGEPIAILQSKSAELGRLIDDLLLGSRLEAGAVEVEGEVVDLRVAVREAVERVRPRADLMEADFEASSPPARVPVRSDPGHLARILDNLLNNALTYSSPPAWVRVRVLAAPPRVEVEDHGWGIPPELGERVFERFFRVDDPDLTRPPGTGLGLYISRDLARMMGGDLRLARSRPARGSTFRLTLSPAS